MNELTHAQVMLYCRIYFFSCKSFMADRTGLDSTTLHYLAVRQAMVSINRPKITITYSLTRDKLTAVHSGEWHYKTPK